MTERQAEKIIQLLEAINKKLDGMTAFKRTWSEEKKEYIDNPDYLSLNVDVMSEVEVTGHVTAHDPR